MAFYSHQGCTLEKQSPPSGMKFRIIELKSIDDSLSSIPSMFYIFHVICVAQVIILVIWEYLSLLYVEIMDIRKFCIFLQHSVERYDW